MATPVARNLTSELATVVPDSSAGFLAPQPKRLKASPPVSPPPQITAVEMTNAMFGCHDGVSPQAYMITVADSLADETLKSGDPDLCYTLSVIPGVYWLILPGIGGKPTYKQAEAAGPGTMPLVLWFHEATSEGGWYIADEAWYDTKARNQKGVKVHLWLGQADTPGPAHYPYWNKKKCDAIKIESYIRFLQNQVEDQKLMLDMMSEQNPAGGNEDAGDHSGGTGGDGAGSSGGSKGGQSRGRGGWIPKLSKLLVSYYKEAYGQVDKQINKFYNESPSLKALVDYEMGWATGTDATRARHAAA